MVAWTHPASLQWVASLILPGIADTNTFLLNTWNTLPEIDQQRVYKHTLAIVKHQVHQAENRTPAMVISVEVVRVDNAIFLDYFTSEVMIEKPQIRRIDQNIPIDNSCTDCWIYPGAEESVHLLMVQLRNWWCVYWLVYSSIWHIHKK